MEQHGKIQNNFRYERKILIPKLAQHELEIMLKLHPAGFYQNYPDRSVNNIYFDFSDYRNYFDHINGLVHRYKARIRWYGGLFGEVKKSFLEFKIKNGLVGRKISYSLQPFLMDCQIRGETFDNLFKESDLSDCLRLEMKFLSPILINHYKRKYFESGDKNYRLTIDTDMNFWRADRHHNSFISAFKDSDNIVLELKYNSDKDDEIYNITNYFPFRVTKNSKYTKGVEIVLLNNLFN